MTKTTLTAAQVLAEIKTMRARRCELTESRGEAPMTAVEMRERAEQFRREVELWDGLSLAEVADPAIAELMLIAVSAAAMRASERATGWALDARTVERATAAAR